MDSPQTPHKSDRGEVATGARLSFTPTSTPQKAAKDSSNEEESDSDSDLLGPRRQLFASRDREAIRWVMV